MRIVVPVAGVGTRMQPHTLSVPKALLPVAGKPMIAQILELFVDLNPSEISIVVGYLGEQLVDYLRSEYSLPFRFYQQTERKGLGHAIFQVLRESEDSETLIVLGDTIIDVDYSALAGSSEVFIGVKEIDDPRRFGIAELDGERVSRLVEKPDEPTSNLAIVGLYYFPSSACLKEALNTLIENDIRTKGEYQLTDALQILIDKGETIRPFPIDGWYDCGKPETLLETQRILLDKKGGFHETVEGSVIRPPVYLSEKATIEGSVIGPYVTLEDDVTVRDSIVSDSIVCRGASLDTCNVVGSIVGIEAKVRGSGVHLNIGQKAESFH